MHSEFRIGRRLVQPELNTIVVSGKAMRVEPKVMEVLVYLTGRPGEVVGRETLIRDLWGDTFVTDAALTRCIAELRKVFDDDVREPRVIQTIAKSGYRLIAPVEPASKDNEVAQSLTAIEAQTAAGDARPHRRLLIPVLLVAAGIIVGALAMFVFLRPVSHQPQQILRTVLPLAVESLVVEKGRAIAMSPDGSRVAYVGTQGGNRRLFVRGLDSAAVTPIPDSDGARGPFFSPDSRWLGFWADGKLKKALLSNLSVVPICDTLGSSGASWGTNGTIVFSWGWLYRVPEAGGQPQVVGAPDPDVYLSWLSLPEILPSGDVALATLSRTPYSDEVVAVPLGGGQRKRVLPDARGPRYVPTGHLVYYHSDRLMAAPFDPILVEVTGPSVVMMEGLDRGLFAFSYSLGTSSFKLVWVDRTGVARQVGPVKAYNQPALSPDGHRIAVTIEKDVWVYDLERETLTQVTFKGGYWPIWTPDGKRLTYVAMRNGALNVVWKSANGVGDEEQLTRSPNDQSASSWSPDGNLLVFQDFHPRTRSDIWLLDVGQGRKLRCFLCTDDFEGSPAFSPDGRWIAYISSESGHKEVYVRPVDGSGKKYQISNGIGEQPLWSRDGKQLFYWKGQRAADDVNVVPMQMMAVDVTLGPDFRAGKPRALFDGSFRWGGRANYDVTLDGKQFLMLQPVQSAPVTQLELVVNWFEELRARVRPTGR